MACAHYVAEIFIKNRLGALLKSIVGMNHGRNAPLIKANDSVVYGGSESFWGTSVANSDSDPDFIANICYTLPLYGSSRKQ